MMSTTQRSLMLVAVIAVLLVAPVARADFDQAMNHYKQGQYAEAAVAFKAIVEEANEPYPDGYFMMAVSLMQSGKLDDAQSAFEKAIQLNDQKFEYQYNLANLYQKRGQYPKVVGTLNKAESLAPNEQFKVAVWKMRGFALAAQGKWAEAIDDLEKASQAKPEGPTLKQLGKAYFSVGENEQAASTLRQANKVAPDADSHKLLSETLMNMAAKTPSDSVKTKHYTEALGEAEAFLELEPRSVDARYMVGRAALGAQQYDKAVSSFEDVLSREPDHCNAMANQAKALTAKKDWRNALVAATNATTCSPGMALAWENKGFVLQKMGSEVEKDDAARVQRYREAIAAYEKASSLKASSSIAGLIDTCKNNIEVIEHNTAADAAEKKQEEAEEAEQRRLEEEARKREEWKKRQEDD